MCCQSPKHTPPTSPVRQYPISSPLPVNPHGSFHTPATSLNLCPLVPVYSQLRPSRRYNTPMSTRSPTVDVLETRLALLEECNSLPFGTVWNYRCETQNMDPGISWLKNKSLREKSKI